MLQISKSHQKCFNNPISNYFACRPAGTSIYISPSTRITPAPWRVFYFQHRSQSNARKQPAPRVFLFAIALIHALYAVDAFEVPMPRRHNRTGRSTTERFVRLPHYLLNSAAWLGLSLAGRAAFVELLAIYNGTNNGTLAMPVRRLAARLCCSKDTASKALIQLEENGFIETVKFGNFTRKNRKASEYRLTLFQCDLSNRRASKAFMQILSQQSDLRDRTVRPKGHAKECNL